MPPLRQVTGRLRGDDGRIVSQLAAPLPAALTARVQCTRIRYMSGGLRITGYVMRPLQLQEPAPVLVFNRAGNREYGRISERTLSYLGYLSSRGYVILASQYRGADGGEGTDGFGGSDIQDVLSLFPLARSLPFADSSRIGMLGYSRGGMMTYLSIKAGAPIRAAAVVGAPSDLIATYRDRPDLQPVLRELIGGTPESHPAAYEARSALYWPDKLNVPILAMHGGRDWRVSAAQSVRLVEALARTRVDHKLVVIPGSDHNLSNHREERNSEIFSWFHHFLSPGSA